MDLWVVSFLVVLDLASDSWTLLQVRLVSSHVHEIIEPWTVWDLLVTQDRTQGQYWKTLGVMQIGARKCQIRKIEIVR